MTQKQRILQYIDECGAITPQEAMIYLSVMRLAARIKELEQDGILLRHDWKDGFNKFGEPIRYMEYRRMES